MNKEIELNNFFTGFITGILVAFILFSLIQDGVI
jgi:multisubunit Na+/H+ antiporter MnhE subunit